MQARVTKVASVSARFSKSLARRLLRPNQEKVRSTTQRRGRTAKPFMVSHRLAIAKRSRGTLCHRSVNLPRVVAAISPDQFDSEGLPMRVLVHSAAIQDRDGAGLVLDKIRRRFPWRGGVALDGMIRLPQGSR
jgi:hypothetical protein